MKNIKYMYFDLDGTLLDSQKVLRLNLLTKILDIKKKYGIKIGLATGRHYLMTVYVINQLNPELPTITNNGASISYSESEHHNLSSIQFNETQKIFNYLYLINCDFLIYTSEKIYTSNQKNWRIIELFEAAKKQKMEHLMWEYHDLNWDELKNSAIHKILACDGKKNDSVIKFVKKKLPHLATVSSEKNLLDIFKNDADKYYGIKKVMDDLNIIYDQMLFFGDNNNDYLALKKITNSIYVGGTIANLISAAKYTTLSSDQDGVLLFLEKYFP